MVSSNFSTKSGTNAFHGEAYEFFRNKVLNSNEYFFKQNQSLSGQSNTPPPYVQNQYGFNVGGPVIKDKTFFFVSWEQFRLRTGAVNVTTVPLPAFKTGDFSALCTSGFDASGVCKDRDASGNVTNQLYDPYTVQPNGKRTAYAGNIIPTSEFSHGCDYFVE